MRPTRGYCLRDVYYISSRSMRARPPSIAGVPDEITPNPCAGVVELADTPDLGSGAARFGGSSPPSRISRVIDSIQSPSAAQARRPCGSDVNLLVALGILVSLLASAGGCSSRTPNSVQHHHTSSYEPAEQFVGNTARGYENFKRDNRSALRNTREFIRDTRAKVERLTTAGPTPLAWDPGDSFPSLARVDGSLLRLTPIMRRHKLIAISRVATNSSASTAAVIASHSNSGRHSILIIDLQTGDSQLVAIDAYDVVWLSESTALVSERVAGEPRVVLSLRAGTTPREIARVKHRGENLLLRAMDQGGYALIEHTHPTWSFFELISAVKPEQALAVTTKESPGSACVVMASSLMCSSFRTHTMGSIVRIDLTKEGSPQTVYTESSGGAIRGLAPTSEGLVVFSSHGSYSTVSLLASDGTLLRGPIAYGPTTSLSPAPPPLRARGVVATKRSFLQPTAHVTVEELFNAPTPRKSSLCDTCVEQSIFAISSDGTRIPISLVSPSDPIGILVYAYGSYGVSTPAEFDPEVLALLRHHVAVAIAHVRGGGELGPAWHQQARGPLKVRAVEDLSASVSELARALTLSPKRIVAHGRSAGAWLVAKTATTRPELFGGVILEAPLLDIENAVRDRDLPLHERERYEWGESLDALRGLAPALTTQTLAFDVLALVPLHDELIPPTVTQRWLQAFECHQGASFQTLASFLPKAPHGGPTSRSEADEWSAAQVVFTKRVLEKER